MLALVAACWLWAAIGDALAQPKFPPLTGRIVDDAGLLTTADRVEILQLLHQLEEKSSDQIVVYTTKSLQGYPIEDFGYQLGRHWQIGQKDKNNGIVLIVAPNERKVRIEVGRGLEPLMTDLMSKLIIDNAILAGFRRGDISGGIKAGVRDIRDVLLGDAAEVEKRARGGKKRSPDSGSDLVFFLIVVAILAVFLWSHIRAARQTPLNSRQQRARRKDGGIVVIPGGSGSWGGGWSGGGDSGGGWSGGGGDFGGGGASGSW